MARAYDHLAALSAHLKSLDSGSKDASAIDCILREVDRLRASKWQLMSALPDYLDCPDPIIVWNDCNGPMEWRVEPNDIERFRDGSFGWTLWCEMPRPSDADIERVTPGLRLVSSSGDLLCDCGHAKSQHSDGECTAAVGDETCVCPEFVPPVVTQPQI